MSHFDSSRDIETPPPPREGTLRIIPLGGVGEFGMNMMALEYGDDIIAIDCGVQFPGHELLGVDLVVPNVEYLESRLKNLRGLFLTHGHEDHIGGLPYTIAKLKTPVYGTALTLGLVRAKLREFDLETKTDLRQVAPRYRIQAGCFEVEFISVTHSIPDATCLAIRTPLGIVVHTGDYRIDPAPVAGDGFDTFSLSRCGEEGVVLLMADSTNVEREGTTESEFEIRETLERIFAEAPRQVIMAMFSTAIYRMQVAIQAAIKTGRKIFIAGYSIERNVEIARELGRLNYPEGAIGDDRSIDSVPPHKRLILTSGTQGEALSALSRMALDNHKRVTIEKDDTVVLSSRMIPGNERAVYRMINNLYRLGAHLFYERNAHVHVSGHAYRDEMRSMLAMTKPKYLMPIHGELYQLIAHKQLAVESGMNEANVKIVEDGQSLELDKNGIHLGPLIPSGPILVDGKTVGEIGEVVLRDRRHLSQDGIITVIMVIDRSNGEILAGPDIVSRGFVHMDENTELIQRCKDVVSRAYLEFDRQSREDIDVVQTGVRKALRKYLREETQLFPIILPVVMEV